MTATLLERARAPRRALRHRDDVHRLRPGDRRRRRACCDRRVGIDRRYSPPSGRGAHAGRAVARNPKEMVARGYDAIALRYAEWAARVEVAGDSSGCGISTDAWLTVRRARARLRPRRSPVTRRARAATPGDGVRHLRRAGRARAPSRSGGELHPRATLLELDVASSSFDAIVARPLRARAGGRADGHLLQRVAPGCDPAGTSSLTFGAGEPRPRTSTATGSACRMFFASLGGDAYGRLLRDGGGRRSCGTRWSSSTSRATARLVPLDARAVPPREDRRRRSASSAWARWARASRRSASRRASRPSAARSARELGERGARRSSTTSRARSRRAARRGESGRGARRASR